MEPERLNFFQDDEEVRKGPWTTDEDLILMNYIANHGEGVWNSLAKAAGLKRTGKSCRLRWLNYLRPDVRRGNITPEEQFLIMDLHSKWGNRWSKIARQLPGRTDNEIKNYWRTRIQKHIKRQQSQSESCLLLHGQVIGGCSEINIEDQSIGRITQVSSLNDIAEPMEVCHNSFPSYQANMESMADDEQQTLASATDGSADNYWSNMEDLWSMQLLN